MYVFHVNCLLNGKKKKKRFRLGSRYGNCIHSLCILVLKNGAISFELGSNNFIYINLYRQLSSMYVYTEKKSVLYEFRDKSIHRLMH